MFDSDVYFNCRNNVVNAKPMATWPIIQNARCTPNHVKARQFILALLTESALMFPLRKQQPNKNEVRLPLPPPTDDTTKRSGSFYDTNTNSGRNNSHH
ncbi:hypothetical protein TNCV_4375831 [Trichonephila clavipes]|uniref:Uncharacterized protein n=1 Tax=Trichonephila clavipes TaxID=2585209 RepID=A0A8X7BDU8_TRICX|nr:hypothetical protein TNCV_4375831 [Trichonephila clavipes]